MYENKTDTEIIVAQLNNIQEILALIWEELKRANTHVTGDVS